MTFNNGETRQVEASRQFERISFRLVTLSHPVRLVFGLLAATFALPVVSAETAGWSCRLELEGRKLDQALRILQQEGLPIFFSSELVTSDLEVERAPCGATPREIMDALLRPHRLLARASVRDRLVVARRPPELGRLEGLAITSAGRPVANVAISFLGQADSDSAAAATLQSKTDRQGRFHLDLPPGEYQIEARRPGYAIMTWGPFAVATGRVTQQRLELVASPGVVEEIQVTSKVGSASENPGTLRLDASALALLPHQNDDWLKAAGQMTGVASAEASARPNVRGGRDDEVLISLDGLELLAPYHLQDFDSALSIVTPSALDSLELIAGGYPASYGDRMGSVIEMATVDSAAADRLDFSLGTHFGEVGAAGSFAGERGHWLARVRAGSQRLALTIRGRNVDPRFWDLMAKADFQLTSAQSVEGHLLLTGDSFTQNRDLSNVDREAISTAWENHYVWVDHAAVVGRETLIESIISSGRVDRDREGALNIPGQSFEVVDQRELRVLGLKQSYLREHGIFGWEAGYQVRALSSSFDYANSRDLAGPLVALRALPAQGDTRFAGSFDFDQVGAYVIQRWRPADARLELDLGLRYDEIGLTHDQRLSPRAELSWRVNSVARLRAAWGHFYQSQRPYELQVEDGEQVLFGSEGSEHRLIGLDCDLPRGFGLRLEAYQRRLSDPRARSENLFDTEMVFPEFGQDRVSLAPDAGRAQGIEMTLRGAGRPRFSWQVSAAYSEAYDEIDGSKVRRAFDQPIAVAAEGAYRWRREASVEDEGWSLGYFFSWHRGWPTTPVNGFLSASGEIEPRLGPLRSDRLPDYHRLDLRLARGWRLKYGRLSAYLDLQNLYDRKNVRGYADFHFSIDEAGGIDLRSRPTTWGGFLPSLGVRWRF